jgi:hypothetical protein
VARLAALTSVISAESAAQDAGASLARRQAMMTLKDKLVFACAMGVMLCGPALAAPVAPAGTYSVDLAVHADGKTRIYKMKLTDEFCGQVKARIDDVEDQIDICTARATGSTVTLRVDWSMSAKTKALSQVSRFSSTRAAGGASNDHATAARELDGAVDVRIVRAIISAGAADPYDDD